MAVKLQAKLLDKIKLKEDVYHFKVQALEIAQIAKPGQFIEKYPDIVTVYTIGDISKELCGGPHVKNTSELGTFKIKKEESSSSVVRRIKAILI